MLLTGLTVTEVMFLISAVVANALWIAGFAAVLLNDSLDPLSKAKWIILIALTHAVGASIALAYLYRDRFRASSLRFRGSPDELTGPEAHLRRRYVSGEIDMEEYERQLEAAVQRRQSRASS